MNRASAILLTTVGFVAGTVSANMIYAAANDKPEIAVSMIVVDLFLFVVLAAGFAQTRS